MITGSDLKEYLKELFYVLEDAYLSAESAELTVAERGRLMDNLREKEVIVSKLIGMINTLDI